MLNDKVYMKIFNDPSEPKEDILLIYKIYFQLVRSVESTKLLRQSNIQIWDYAINYFKNNNEGRIGATINADIQLINYSTENLFKVNMIIGKFNKFTPNYYTKSCGTSGLFVFFLKDILEWSGVLVDKKPNPPKLYELAKYACEYYEKAVDKFSSG